MIFGEIDVEDAEGAILAHATRHGTIDLKKGARLEAGDVRKLRAAGIERIVAARLDDGDVGEDAAAQRIADALAGPNLHVGLAATGRVNIHATCAGIFRPDRALVDALNGVDPGITLATLPDGAAVRERQMIATIKIIPLAVAGSSIERVLALLALSAAMSVAPFAARSVTLIQTVLPATSVKMLDKTVRVTKERLAKSGSELAHELRVPHRVDALAEAISGARASDLILVFGASAVIDRRDVIPSAIEMAGGEIDYFGMPVDPGNLLLLGHFAGRPIIGAPGCARSPKENGFDWVLDRLLAGETVNAATLQGFGVGGLLAEIEMRPRPRQASQGTRPVAVDIVVLAAGRSRRMGEGNNKLLSDIRPGVPLVRHAVTAALSASRASKVHVVLGHRRDDVEAALAGLAFEPVVNAGYAEGLSSSLKAGFEAAGAADGILVLLADQPLVTGDDLDQLIAAFERDEGRSIVAACDGDKRRNPVIIPARFAEEIARLDGDTGAAPLLARLSAQIRMVDLGERASFDTDTPDQFHRAQMRLAGTGHDA
ncbi:molybdopterin-binding/glycosyltransferase family 2 protein [Fulvimarina sp. 2208YS6-2-32]|uniref:Molybdopterin-binding/glycosyltransferase family 2 protein n=1 Tax=Fulvimarina uroteuthidis TaxID=3098149 RepID=A0ABU5I5C8_9HYPH|nr:molybdopterin-binding/glycosyltransferase family 2 protein [Fulvimarina sp. 2208YS6-2-32]MDY8110411.1 molybdopterin-binding/glycosyltransferase family 2 protein [Fulvimarina sp. 2208YS6-2-32]